MRKVKFILFIMFIFIFNSFSTKVKEYEPVTSQGLEIKEYMGLNKIGYKNYTGKNVTVAILDSGITPNNDISNKRILEFKDFTDNKRNMYDDFGHGTFIVGIIGANGYLKGMATDVNFVILKVLDKYGLTNEQTLCNAINWLISNKEKYNIKVVNISVGVPAYLPYNKDIVCNLIKKLKDSGAIIICSAGNNGPEKNTVLSPGISPDVITVGSINNNYSYSIEDDTVTSFSSRGSVADSIKKPDLLTLGVNIRLIDYTGNLRYINKSGTSYSAAIISGVAAILFEKYKNQPSSLVENVLKDNTYKLKSYDYNSQGSGELIFK